MRAHTMIIVALVAACQSRPKPSFDQCAAITNEISAPTPAPLHADGPYFKDELGRVVLLRGVNVAGDSKVPPFMTITDASQLDPLPGFGLNVVRLLFTWEAFEPSPCTYDEAYLAYFERVTSWAGARGLYVIVDFHQDAFSRFSIDGCGEGFPEWAVLSSLPTHAPDNGRACEAWGIKMVFDSTHLDTWTAFHRDLEGARTRFLAMVSRVAARMSSHPNVIGYDVLNEPWGQSYELHALFEDIGTAIRAQDPERILFIPPQALGSSGAANIVPRVSHTNIAHSPHYYDAAIVVFKAWHGAGVGPPLDGMLQTATEWNAPMLLAEFGAGVSIGSAAAYIEAFYAWLDERFVSGTQWNYTPGWTADRKDGWNTEDFSITGAGLALRKELFTPRPYPQKTAGVPIAFRRHGRGFTYRWTHDPSLGATEIFAPDGNIQSEGVRCVRVESLLSCTGEAGEAVVTVSE
ncbi:MAG: cellulase family glycosylhydrolase [Deltaproteobacteria bacterium]|nr:cellulase family glycosylhydrolase [Deltaproteobacteria bacterium]